MTVQKQIDRLIAQRASEWVEALKTAGPAEREAFVDWLRESRRHVEEFLTLVALDRELNGIDLHGVVDREALLKRISPQMTSFDATSSLRGSRSAQRPHRRRWLAAAAVLLTAASGWTAYRYAYPTHELISGAQESRSIELADGSIVQLNNSSHVRTRLRPWDRKLELLSGEALFKVAPDAHRPFRVHTRDAVVQALGTQFSVNTRSDGTRVSVLEGRVRVSSGDVIESAQDPLRAGEEVFVEPAGTIKRNNRPDVVAVTAWRRQRLVFKSTPLEEVAQAFNRHNATPKFRLEGLDPNSHHYSATFDADDPESFADLLDREPDLVVERREFEVLVRKR